MIDAPLPEDSAFLQFEVVYPNPVINKATLIFHVRQPAHVRLDVYNLLGRRATVLLDSVLPAGAHQIQWRAAGLPAGSYVVRLQAGSSIQTRSVMLIR